MSVDFRFLVCLCAMAGPACRQTEPVASDETRGRPAETRVLAADGRASATPYVASRGDFVAVVWSASGEGATDLFLATSGDGGRSFSPPLRVNDVPGDVNVYGEQPPRVALGSGAPAPLYVTWTSADREKELSFLRFARSLDGGQSFEPAVTLHPPDLAGARGWHSLLVSPTGEVHSLWLDARPHEAAALVDRFLPTAHAHGHEARMGLYHLAWDGGAPAEARRLFEPVCECCKTAMAVGNDGSVYAAWRHIYEDNYRDIAVAVSPRGMGFGDAARVNRDGWQIDGCPDDGPSMVVDGSNRAHLIWPTLVHEKMDMGIFHASTADGISFSPRSPVPGAGGMDPSHPQLALDGSGRLAAVWDEAIEKKRRVVLARAVLAANGSPSWSGPELLDDGTEGSSASYPVVAASGSGVLVAWTQQTGDDSVIRVRRIE
jgi:hypothetical protein